MFNRKVKKKIEVNYIITFSILDSMILRLNRGLTLKNSMESVKQNLNYKVISETFNLVESDLPINVEEFDESHFYIALLEVLRQSKDFDPYKICDILVFLRNSLQHTVFFGDQANTWLFTSGIFSVTPEDYAKSIIECVK